jgi:hypothetical protein
MQSGHNFNVMRIVVQQYIQDLTGKKILIIVNTPREMLLLERAYLIAKNYKNEFNTTNKD